MRRSVCNALYRWHPMRAIGKHLGAVLLCGLAILNVATPSARASQPGLTVKADREQIYLGESVVLTVRVSGSTDTTPPDLSALKNCTTQLIGSRAESRSSFQMINGRWQKSSFHGRTFQFKVTPTTDGDLQTGPVRATIAGRTFTARGPTVLVEGVQKQDVVKVSVEGSRDSVLVDEPFEITLKINLKRLDGQYRSMHPLDPRDPPRIEASYLQGEPIEGLKSPDVRSELQKHLVDAANDPGFAINNYTLRSNPFDMHSMFDFNSVFEKQPAVFMFDRRLVQIDGEDYSQYSITFGYVPKEEGSYTFGPAVFKGPVATDVQPRGHLVTRSIFTVGPAFTVHVVPPPEEGRPDSYIGAIGSNLHVKASLDTQTCTVGDPLTLTLTISGNVSLDNVRPPSLTEQADLNRDFRIYEDTVKLIKQPRARQYQYTIRPTRAGTIEVPPIEVAYFDSESRTYKRVTSEPIPLRANAAADLGEGMIIADQTNGVAESPIERDASRSPAPMSVTTAGASAAALLGGTWQIPVLVAGPLVFLLACALRWLQKLRRSRTAGNRQKGALSRARESLRHTPDATAPLLDLCNALRRYVSDRLGINAAGMSPEEIRERLEAELDDPEPAERLTDILERSAHAVYSGHDAPDDMDAACREASMAVAQLDKALRIAGRRR